MDGLPIIQRSQRRRKIHVAFLSTDLRESPTGHLLRGVLGRHDRARIGVTCYSLVDAGPNSAVQTQLKAACNGGRDEGEGEGEGGDGGSSWLDGAVECMLEAGETIYVPAGWWHTVLNTEDTVAVTENFMSPHNARSPVAV